MEKKHTRGNSLQKLDSKEIKDMMQKVEEDTEKRIKTLKEMKEQKVSGYFIFDKNEIVNSVIFSCDRFKDNFAYGFLLPKMVPIITGKGKNKKIIGREQIRSPAVVTSDRNLIEPTSEMENKFKVKYTAIPTDLKLRIDLEVLKDFLENNNDSIEGEILFNSIKDTYEKYIFFHNPIWYKVHALWDMGTYFFPLFNNYPLMELRGLSGTGKSKTMQISRLFTLNPTSIMVNPSEASLFRVTHSKRPTKYIDEAEKLFTFIGGQWQSSPVVELINGSYTKGSSVPRLEKEGNSFRLVEYQCYSPTMIGSIAGLMGATETRAITHISTKSSDNDSRGELDIEESFQESEEFKNIRNNLYIFGLENWQKIEQIYKNLKINNLKKRDFQLWKPLLTIAKTISEELYEEILEFAVKISIQKKQDFISEGTMDYKILEILKNQVELGADPIYMSKIAFDYNENSEKKITSKTLSSHLDKIGFKEFRDRDSKGSCLRINKQIYEMIVNPISNTLSTYSTYSTQNKGNSVKSNDECVLNNVEKENGKMLNMMNNVEYVGNIQVEEQKPEEFGK